VTTRCTIPPACAHRGAAATREASLGPLPQPPRHRQRGTQATTHLGGPRLASLQQQFTDPTILQRLTLGRLGASIEFTVHNTMHLRWSEEMPQYRLGGDPFNVDPHFDEPSYNWLADFYSSHVNPIFWKLHGWVDARIDDWTRANQRTGPVPWTVTPWVGPMPPGHEHHTMARHALRAPVDKTEADALRGQLDDLEAMINDAKATGTREPTPFVTIDWSPRDSA
jgi:hypothetical protein